MKKAAAFILLLGLLGYAFWNAFGQKEERVGLDKGSIAPDFELTALDGSAFKLSELRGKKVILNFWATWCPPCQAEMPEMQKFHEQYGKEVEIVGVNLTDSESDPEKVQEYINNKGVTFTIPLDQDGDISSLYRVKQIPTSFVLDQDGKIKKKILGAMSYESMLDAVNGFE